MLLRDPGGPAERNAWFFGLAGLTVKVESDLPLNGRTFASRFERFHLTEPGEDSVSLRHHFCLPDLRWLELGEGVFRNPPWEIRRQDDHWLYLGISPDSPDHGVHQVAIFDDRHDRGEIYHPDDRWLRLGNMHSLAFFPTDQIWLARVLADRQACYLHAAGMIIDGQGLAFVGHSEAGKSTTVTMLQQEGQILCDDRVIVRRWPEGFRVHGTWSHGDVPIVSPASAPLRAILLLEQAQENRLVPVERREVVRQLPFFVVKPLVTADWWEKTLDLVGDIAREVPVYRLRLDRSGAVVWVIRDLLQRLS